MSVPEKHTELVLYRLEELKEGQDGLRGEVKELRGDVVVLRETVAGLKVKTSLRAALVGGISGGLPAIGAALYWLLK